MSIFLHYQVFNQFRYLKINDSLSKNRFVLFNFGLNLAVLSECTELFLY